MPVKQAVVDQLSGEWQTGLFEAPCTAPLSFCYGCCCVCCMAGQQRLQILDVIGEPYVCCGGMFPCGPLGDPQDRSCVWAEACCCAGLAVSGNRFLVQTRFDRQNTACDDCILWMTCLAPYLICLCECAGVEVPQEVENCVDCLQHSVVGCMLAQQQVEIDYVQKTGFQGPSPAVVAALPPMQQQMISQARPGLGAAVGMAAGAAVGGAAGAAAMCSAAQQGRPQAAMAVTPAPQVMGYPAAGAEAFPAAPMPVYAGAPGAPQGGFMGTVAPNGMPWWQYCQGSQVGIDPATGHLHGPWGQCLAWAKVYEIQNPAWSCDPSYASGGPCRQVIGALSNAAPFHMRAPAAEAAERLEAACEAAAAAGAPLPVIGQRA